MTVSQDLIEIPRAECLALLASQELGRVAVCAGPAHQPLIRPVNYRFDRSTQSIVFRSLEGSKLHGLTRNARACFEVDGHDRARRSGWSVIVLGPVELVTRPAELARLATLPQIMWPDPVGAHWVRIRAGTVTGRRLATVADGL